MLDHFTILTSGGLSLWTKSYTPVPSPVNALISSALIQERSTSTGSNEIARSVSKWDKDGYTILYTLDNELELVFIVAYQRLLQLTYVEDFLLRIKALFVGEYRATIERIGASCAGKAVPEELKLEWNGLFAGWEEVFTRVLREFELADSKNKKVRTKALPSAKAVTEEESPSEAPMPTKSGESEVVDAASVVRNIAALKARQRAAVKGKGKAVVGSETPEPEVDAGKKSTPTKTARKWGDSKVTAADMALFDYSSDKPSDESGTSTPNLKGLVSDGALGTRGKNGMYEVADYKVKGGEDEADSATTTGTTSSFYGLLSKLSLTPKSLTAADLAPALLAMREHLMSKNVAKEIADKVCEGVGKSLEGRKVGGFGSVRLEVKRALEESLVKILTPKSSTDLLLDITKKKNDSLGLLSYAPSTKGKDKNLLDPYSITFVGVNGVGKSTNLSKVAYWLIQNDLKVLIAACDTFRSGAVEQLRTHVRNLGSLGSGAAGETKAGKIELFERGYGKDAAGIAKDAIAYGKENQFDVVLIDTAGRMQDNEPLMRALAKLVTVNNPDKILFVGEALAGNEAVDQLTKFNRSLRDFSGGSNNPRGIDGMILTKFDTIDDKVGAALSMTYVTGQPILFVGTGQTYSDLRSLRVQHIVQALLQN